VTSSCGTLRPQNTRQLNEATNLIFASDWQFAHHVNWWKAYEEAQNIFLTIAIGSIVLPTTGMETSSLSRTPRIAEFVIATWCLQVAYII